MTRCGARPRHAGGESAGAGRGEPWRSDRLTCMGAQAWARAGGRQLRKRTARGTRSGPRPLPTRTRRRPSWRTALRPSCWRRGCTPRSGRQSDRRVPAGSERLPPLPCPRAVARFAVPCRLAVVSPRRPTRHLARVARLLAAASNMPPVWSCGGANRPAGSVVGAPESKHSPIRPCRELCLHRTKKPPRQ